MNSFLQFDGVDGTSPLDDNWAAGTAGTQGTTVVSPAAIANDAAGGYLGPGLPIVAKTPILPDRLPFRIHVSCNLGVNALARAVAPIAGDSYVTVEVLNNGGYALFRAWLTAPDVKPHGSGVTHYPLGRQQSEIAIRETEMFTFEFGPRYARVFRAETTEPGTLYIAELQEANGPSRTPVFGVGYPELELETWGVFTEAGKIRSVRVTTTEPELIMTGAVTGTSDGVDPVTSGLGNAPRLLLDDSRPALITYRVVPGLFDSKTVAAISGWSRSGTGRIPDSRFLRLDSEQSIMLIPQAETFGTVITMADTLTSGPRSSELQVYPPTEPTGPDVGIGSGRTIINGNGELAFEVGYMYQGSGYGFEVFDLASNGPEPKARQSVSRRVQKTWKLRGVVKPRALRRLERLTALHGSSRPVWCMPSLEPEPVPAFLGALSSVIAGVNKCRIQTEITEA